jgi:hypothetical protein
MARAADRAGSGRAWTPERDPRRPWRDRSARRSPHQADRPVGSARDEGPGRDRETQSAGRESARQLRRPPSSRQNLRPRHDRRRRWLFMDLRMSDDHEPDEHHGDESALAAGGATRAGREMTHDELRRARPARGPRACAGAARRIGRAPPGIDPRRRVSLEVATADDGRDPQDGGRRDRANRRPGRGHHRGAPAVTARPRPRMRSRKPRAERERNHECPRHECPAWRRLAVSLFPEDGFRRPR